MGQTNTQEMTPAMVFDASMYVREHVICNKFWKQQDAEKELAFRAVHSNFESMFQMGITLLINIDPSGNPADGGGKFDRENNAIILSKMSLMTYLHIYGLALARNGYIINENSEFGQAVAWAHTVFCASSLKVYRNGRDNNLFFYSTTLLDPVDGGTDEDVDAQFLNTFASWHGTRLPEAMPANFYTRAMRAALDGDVPVAPVASITNATVPVNEEVTTTVLINRANYTVADSTQAVYEGVDTETITMVRPDRAPAAIRQYCTISACYRVEGDGDTFATYFVKTDEGYFVFRPVAVAVTEAPPAVESLDD